MNDQPIFHLDRITVVCDYWERGGITSHDVDIPAESWLVFPVDNRHIQWAATSNQITDHYTPASIGAYRELRRAGLNDHIPAEIEHALEARDEDE